MRWILVASGLLACSPGLSPSTVETPNPKALALEKTLGTVPDLTRQPACVWGGASAGNHATPTTSTVCSAVATTQVLVYHRGGHAFADTRARELHVDINAGCIGHVQSVPAGCQYDPADATCEVEERCCMGQVINPDTDGGPFEDVLEAYLDRYGGPGWRVYYRLRSNYNTWSQLFEAYKLEIDNRRPALIHIYGEEDIFDGENHTMVVVGYDDDTEELFVKDNYEYSVLPVEANGASRIRPDFYNVDAITFIFPPEPGGSGGGSGPGSAECELPQNIPNLDCPGPEPKGTCETICEVYADLCTVAFGSTNDCEPGFHPDHVCEEIGGAYPLCDPYNPPCECV